MKQLFHSGSVSMKNFPCTPKGVSQRPELHEEAKKKSKETPSPSRKFFFPGNAVGGIRVFAPRTNVFLAGKTSFARSCDVVYQMIDTGECNSLSVLLIRVAQILDVD